MKTQCLQVYPRKIFNVGGTDYLQSYSQGIVKLVTRWYLLLCVIEVALYMMCGASRKNCWKSANEVDGSHESDRKDCFLREFQDRWHLQMKWQ